MSAVTLLKVLSPIHPPIKFQATTKDNCVLQCLTSTMFPHNTNVKKIERKILSLEEQEKKLAAHYGMVGDIDSVEVFDEAKCRAFAKLGLSFEDDLRAMNELMFLRLQLAQLRH
ncbi:hypothetical protein IW262DRAFT_1469291 [Armillaria fumosa]|nr:hypothetical protein IW262DRAFT_1469291 [Armillaria fumosa]